MAALRFLAFLFFLLAAVVLATDGTRSRLNPGVPFWVPLQKHWQDLSPKTLEASKRGIEKVHPALWSVGLAPVLRPPGWLVAGSIGLVLSYLGRHRRKVRIFVN